jgi:hypothetical protein
MLNEKEERVETYPVHMRLSASQRRLAEELLCALNYHRIRNNEPLTDLSGAITAGFAIFLEEHLEGIMESYEVTREDATRALAARHIPRHLEELAGVTGSDVSDFRAADFKNPGAHAALDRLILGVSTRSTRAAAGLHRTSGSVQARGTTDRAGASRQDEESSRLDRGRKNLAEQRDDDIRRTLQTLEHLHRYVARIARIEDARPDGAGVGRRKRRRRK